LANISVSHFADSDYNDRKPAIGFSLAANAEVLNYTLSFVTSPESAMGTDLTDFENKNIQILGKDYFVLDFKNSTAKLTLLDSATTGTVAEGEYIWNVLAYDNGTNSAWASSNFSFSYAVAVDTSPPIISVKSPTNKTYTTSTIWFNISAVNTGVTGMAPDGPGSSPGMDSLVGRILLCLGQHGF